MNLARVFLPARQPGPQDGVVDEHLVAASDETPWAEIADVVVGTDAAGPAAARVRALLARHPGCLVAVAPDTGGGCVVGVRHGRVRRFATGDPATLGSVVHAWVRAGLPFDALDGVPPGAVVTRAAPAPQAVGVPGRRAATGDRRRSPAPG